MTPRAGTAKRPCCGRSPAPAPGEGSDLPELAGCKFAGGDEDAPPLLFADVLSALPDRRHRVALLDMVRQIGRVRAIGDAPARRIAARNDLIRRAFDEHYARLGKTHGAGKLAEDLLLHANGPYPELASNASARRHCLHWIIFWNEGNCKGLGKRNIHGLL